MLGDWPELIGTPGMPPVAVPGVFHHLTGRRQKRTSRRRKRGKRRRRDERR